MGRMYSATFEEVAVTAAQDLFSVFAPSDAIVIIHGFEISQSSDTDNENLSLLIHRATQDGGSGTAPTARPMEVGDTAFGGTLHANATTQGAEGTFIHAAAFSVLSGYVWMPTPEMRPVIPPSGSLAIELQSTPGDSLTMSGTLYFEEVG